MEAEFARVGTDLLAHLREGAPAQRTLMTWARVAKLWESLLMRLGERHAGEGTYRPQSNDQYVAEPGAG